MCLDLDITDTAPSPRRSNKSLKKKDPLEAELHSVLYRVAWAESMGMDASTMENMVEKTPFTLTYPYWDIMSFSEKIEVVRNGRPKPGSDLDQALSLRRTAIEEAEKVDAVARKVASIDLDRVSVDGMKSCGGLLCGGCGGSDCYIRCRESVAQEEARRVVEGAIRRVVEVDIRKSLENVLTSTEPSTAEGGIRRCRPEWMSTSTTEPSFGTVEGDNAIGHTMKEEPCVLVNHCDSTGTPSLTVSFRDTRYASCEV